MRITHISSADNKGGGARSAYRLHKALIRDGVDSKMFVKSKYTEDETVIKYRPSSSNLQRLAFRIRRRFETGGVGYFTAGSSVYNGFSPPYAPPGLAPLAQMPEADIANLHWISGFWDLRLLPMLVGRCSGVVWRLSDMNPFTGGCFYDDNCNRYKDDCGCCPCLGSNKPGDLSKKSIIIKKKILEKLPDGFLHIVAQSHWIEDKIKESSLFGSLPVTRIQNGIDTNQLYPNDKKKARQLLGLEQDHTIILFVSQFLSNPRKGLTYFINAIDKFASTSDENITVLALGGDSLPPIEGVNITQVELKDDDPHFSYCYSAADLFLITSLQDNLPNTVLESMACSTPVVGFDVGGIPDMVMNGETGFLVPARDVSQLVIKMREIITNKNLHDHFSIKCRERVVNYFSLDTQVKSYRKLYENIASERIDNR